MCGRLTRNMIIINTGLMELPPRPPACGKGLRVDGKQEINLEWPYALSSHMYVRPALSPDTDPRVTYQHLGMLQRYDMRHEMLTQRAPFCISVMAKKGHAESAFRDTCQLTRSTLCYYDYHAP